MATDQETTERGSVPPPTWAKDVAREAASVVPGASDQVVAPAEGAERGRVRHSVFAKRRGAVGLAAAAVGVLALVLVLVVGGGGEGATAASPTYSRFVSACNIAETYAVSAGYGGPQFSCRCVVRKALAAPGSEVGAGGLLPQVIDSNTNEVVADEHQGKTEEALLLMIAAFGNQINTCHA